MYLTKCLIMCNNSGYFYGMGQYTQPRSSFLSDRAQFRKASLAELMHEQHLLEAWTKYKLLGGDQLLVSKGYSRLPGGIDKRLEIAIHLSDELHRAREWQRIGRQSFTDRGAQYYAIFEGMLKDLERNFEARVLKIIMPVLQFPDSSFFVYRLIDFVGSDSFPIAKREFIQSLDGPLQEVAGRILHSVNGIDNIHGLVKLLFTNCDFIEMAFEHIGSYSARMYIGNGNFVIDKHYGNLKQRLNMVVPFQHSANDPDVSAEALRLCCEAVVGSAEERQKSMDRLIKLGNQAELCPSSGVLIVCIIGLESLPRPCLVPLIHVSCFDTCGITRLSETKALALRSSNRKPC